MDQAGGHVDVRATTGLLRPSDVIKWEIGCIYRANGQFFIAITERNLLTVKGGEGKVIRPYTRERYSQVRSISVEELAQKWKVSVDQMDEITSKYLYVKAEPRPAPRGSRRQAALSENEWRARRTVRELRVTAS
jgi:hypothetical protein